MDMWKFYTPDQLKADGWLKRQLELQAKGLCGNLDKIWPDIRDSAWIGGDAESWERVPYWLDGFIPLACLLEDSNMKQRAQKYIDAIVANQKSDGWICPCKDEERKSYDTWAVLLIAKTLTVAYSCLHDERLPRVIYRVLKNYYDLLKKGELQLFDWGKARWYEGFIAIAFTYERYPEAWLPELAAILKAQGTDYRALTQLWKRPLNLWRQETHIVNLMMMLKAEAVSHDLLGLPYSDSAQALWDILEAYNGTAVGTITGDECLSGISPIQGTELCAVVELMYSYELLFAHTGDPKWADRLEKVAFNALPATLSDDMWTHQYVQMSNQIACRRFPGKPVFRTNNQEAHLFGLEPHFGCCTANFGQGWPKLALSAFLHSSDSVISAVPVPSRLETPAQRITLETDYPFGNKLTYHISAEKDFEFLVRIPGFAKNLTVNGRPATGKQLRFPIRGGTQQLLEITFDAEPCFVPRPNGLQAVSWGNLMFSVPITAEKKMYEYTRDGVERKFPYCDYELLPTSPWSWAYCAEPLTGQFRPLTGIPFNSEAPAAVVRATVRPIEWGLEDGYETVCRKVPTSTAPTGPKQQLLLYPYGCAKLRMTELPFAGEA